MSRKGSFECPKRRSDDRKSYDGRTKLTIRKMSSKRGSACVVAKNLLTACMICCLTWQCQQATGVKCSQLVILNEIIRMALKPTITMSGPIHRRRRRRQVRAAHRVLLLHLTAAAFGPQPATAFVPASTTKSNRHLQRANGRSSRDVFSSSSAGASIDTLETTCEDHGNSSPQPQTQTPTNTAPTIDRDLISQAIINSVKQRGSESYRRSYNKWSSTALEHIQAHLGTNLPVAPDADATAQLGFELGVAADYGQMPSFGDSGARAGYALDYFCRVKLLGDVLFGERMNAWRHEQQQQDQSSSSSQPSYLGNTITDLLCNPKNREVCRIGSLGGGPGFDHVAATVLATHAALEREVQYCIDTNAEASFPDDAEESDSLPRLAVEDILSHMSSRTTPPMPRIETTVYEYEAGWDDIIPYMEQSTQSVLDLGQARHRCRFAGCDITLPLTHGANAQCYQQAQSTDLWICSYCVAENAIRLRANEYVFFVELFEAAQEGAVFVFTETTHRLWPEIIDVATKANSETGREAAEGFDVAFPRIQRGRGKAGFQLALRKASGATLGEDVQATCERFRRDNAMHELKISGGYKRQKRKIRGAK